MKYDVPDVLTSEYLEAAMKTNTIEGSLDVFILESAQVANHRCALSDGAGNWLKEHKDILSPRAIKSCLFLCTNQDTRRRNACYPLDKASCPRKIFKEEPCTQLKP